MKKHITMSKFEINKSTLSSAIKIGIESKLIADPQFRQALLNTAGSSIMYLSKNNYLGYGNGKWFVNTYGIWLNILEQECCGR